MWNVTVVYKNGVRDELPSMDNKRIQQFMTGSSLLEVKMLTIEWEEPLTPDEQYARHISQAMHGNPVMVPQALYDKLPPAYQKICKVTVPMPVSGPTPYPYTDGPHY